MTSDEQRQHIRFIPDPLEIALLDFKDSSFNNFNKKVPLMETDAIALIENESHNGASIVMVVKEKNPSFLFQGKKCIVKLGPLEPMRAEVKWLEWLEDLIVKAGIAVID